MRSLTSALFLAALTTASPAQAGSAPAQPAPPVWSAKWFIPQGTILPRDQVRPPAVIGFRFKMTPPTGWSVTWTNNVQAFGKRLSQEVSAGQGEADLYFKIDPCDLASLDTPGTEIPVNYEFVFTARQPQGEWKPPISKGTLFLKLAQDTVAPFISEITGRPNVHRDETVQVVISATDVSDEMGGGLVWDSGLHVFRLEGPSNPNQPGTQVYVADDSVPQTCNEKVKKADHSFSYTVPHSAQPGDEIRLLLEVEDWSGNKTKDYFKLFVVEEPKVDKPKPDTPFPPRAGCKDVRRTITHYQGIGGKCSGTMFICGETFPAGCNPQWFRRPNAVAGSEKGAQVCCDDWQKARKSKQPCDVALDADCDGIPNNRDRAPFNTGNEPPPQPKESDGFFQP
jgi:hypothetical protein